MCIPLAGGIRSRPSAPCGSARHSRRRSGPLLARRSQTPCSGLGLISRRKRSALNRQGKSMKAVFIGRLGCASRRPTLQTRCLGPMPTPASASFTVGSACRHSSSKRAGTRCRLWQRPNMPSPVPSAKLMASTRRGNAVRDAIYETEIECFFRCAAIPRRFTCDGRRRIPAAPVER